MRQYVYVLIDTELDVVICVGRSHEALVSEAYKQDTYFNKENDFYEHYDEKYLIERHEVLVY